VIAVLPEGFALPSAAATVKTRRSGSEAAGIKEDTRQIAR